MKAMDATQDSTGQHRRGQNSTGQDRTGQDRTGQNRTAQDSTGQGRAAQVKRNAKIRTRVSKTEEKFKI